MPRLDVYISKTCWSCQETREIVAEMQGQFPEVKIELLDIDPQEWPDKVFAVPTYLLNGNVISLGNPSRERLQTTLKGALSVAV